MTDGRRVQELTARFFTGTKLNRNKSDGAGRPVYDDVEMVEILFPGDTRTVVTAPAREETMLDGEFLPYYRRFSREYEAFKSGADDFVDGTKIETVAFLTEAQKKELAAVNVRSVEQLASMSGRGLYRLGPSGTAMREKAEAYLERAETGKAAQEAESLRRRVDELEAALAIKDAPKPMAVWPGQVEDEAVEAPVILDRLTDAELKLHIKERTGETPRGNPSRETLLRQAADAR